MGSPLVGIIMGSDSDLPVMEQAAQVLLEMGITFEMDISSAHRLPDKTADYARSARDRGIEVARGGEHCCKAMPRFVKNCHSPRLSGRTAVGVKPTAGLGPVSLQRQAAGTRCPWSRDRG